MLDRLLPILSSTYVWAAALAVAAALALSWTLRGAPIGQAAEAEDDEDAPAPGYRDRVVAAAVAGILAIAAGAYVAAAFRIPWSLPFFGLGTAIILTLNRANRRHRHASPSLRRVVDTSNAALNVALLGGILVVGNVLAFKYGGRPIDFTADRVNSLATLSTSQVKSLDRPVKFTLVIGQSRLVGAQWDSIRQVLDLLRRENPGKVSTATLNPYDDPLRFTAAQRDAPELAVATQGGGVLVEYGEGKGADRVVVRAADLFNEEPSAGSGQVVASDAEDALISALIRLREGTKSRISFITGHGEPSIHDLDPARNALGLLRSRLERLGARIVVNNLVRDELDPGTELAILAGATRPFQPEELRRLTRYLDGGGKLLVFAGFRVADAEPTGLEGWLKGHDVEVGPGLVLDPTYCYAFRPEIILAPILGEIHQPIVEPLAETQVVLPVATPVKAATQPTNAKVLVAEVLRSSPESWLRTDMTLRKPHRGPKEPPGPVPVAVAVAGRSPGGGPGVPRMVVIGSDYAAANPYAPHNFDLIVNAVNWLRGRAGQRGAIPPKRHTTLALSSNPQLRAKIVLVPTLMAVSVIIGFGVATYLVRRD